MVKMMKVIERNNLKNAQQQIQISQIKSKAQTMSNAVNYHENVSKKKLVITNENQSNKKRFDLLKLFKIVVIVVILVLISLSLFEGYHFYIYLQISTQIKQGIQIPPKQFLTHLDILTWRSMPLNYLFYQQKIQQLAKLQQWDQVINEANRALQYESNENVFSIYYHKAVGYCQKGMLGKCKDTAIEAMNFGTRQEFYYVKDVLDILLSNNAVTEEEINYDGSFLERGRYEA